MNNELKEIKSSATCLLLEVRENAQIVSSLSDKGGSTSDITSQTSDSDSGIQTVEHLPESDSESALPDSKFAVLLSDTDMSELATKTSHLLNCQVDMVNYSEGLSDPTLFQRELQFVMIQGSGEILTKFNEVNKVIIEELTAHVQTLVKVAVNILEMQPSTRVFLGSLPPRLDGRVSRDLTRIYNSLLVTESFMVDQISVIDQSQLNSHNEVKVYQRYEEDLFTLTEYGNRLKERNVVQQIAQAVPGLKVARAKKRQISEQKNHHLKHYQWGGRRFNNPRRGSFMLGYPPRW